MTDTTNARPGSGTFSGPYLGGGAPPPGTTFTTDPNGTEADTINAAPWNLSYRGNDGKTYTVDTRTVGDYPPGTPGLGPRPPGSPGAPTGPGAAPPPDTSGGTADQKSAQSIIQSLLDSYGLGSLAGWAWGLITQGAGASQVELQLRQRPEFAARFPGIKMREKNGLPPISPGEYVTYEKQANELFHQAGLPPDFYRSSDHLASFIGSDVSLSELGQRVQQGYAAAMQAPAEVRNQLQNVYGIDAGHLTAFFLDPDQALPLVMKKFQAAKIGAEGVLTGYGQLGQGSLEDLAARGVTDTQARQGFNHLGMESQLFGALPGSAESNISQQVQLGAEFGGNAEDQKMIENQARGRVAEFGGGYGYAGSATGVSGLGSAKQ